MSAPQISSPACTSPQQPSLPRQHTIPSIKTGSRPCSAITDHSRENKPLPTTVPASKSLHDDCTVKTGQPSQITTSLHALFYSAARGCFARLFHCFARLLAAVLLGCSRLFRCFAVLRGCFARLLAAVLLGCFARLDTAVLLFCSAAHGNCFSLSACIKARSAKLRPSRYASNCYGGALRRRIATEQALTSSQRSFALFGPAGSITGVQATLSLVVCRLIYRLKTSTSPSFGSTASDVAPTCVLERGAINTSCLPHTTGRLEQRCFINKNHRPAYSRAPREKPPNLVAAADDHLPPLAQQLEQRVTEQRRNYSAHSSRSRQYARTRVPTAPPHEVSFLASLPTLLLSRLQKVTTCAKELRIVNRPG